MKRGWTGSTIRSAAIGCGALLGLGFSGPALAQGTPEQPVPHGGGGAVLFEGEPYEVRDLGLVLYLPVGCTVSRSYIPGGMQALAIEPDAESWTMRAYVERVTDASLTPAVYLDRVIEQHHAARARNAPPINGRAPLPYSVVDRTDELRVGDLSGSRAYLEVPGSGTAVASGYAVFRLGNREFLMFQIDSEPEGFARSRAVFETIIAASTFNRPDPEEQAERAASLAAGERFLEGLTAQDLEAALPSGVVLLRLYEPAKTNTDADARELGYQRVDLRTGQLGEVTGRPRHTWTPAERRFGFLATVDGRFLDSGRVIDVNAQMYLSRDRREETWSLVTTVTGMNHEKGVEESVSNTQTLIRNGERLTSRTLVPNQPPLIRDWVLPDRGFLSGVETYLLPRLVAAAELGVPFSFYHFHTVRGSLSLRRDTFVKTATGWTREELRSELDQPQHGVYTSEGELIRTTLANGTVIEPIEPQRLLRLWKDKGLPVR
ncbi:MAG: hypothetical protein ACTS3F_09560 [Phycisphaerales bacterium]